MKFWQRAKVATKFAFGRYEAVKQTRNRGRRGTDLIRGEELELKETDRETLVSAALQLRRDNPVVTSISRLRKADTVGRGVVPQPRTGDEALDRELEDRWNDYMRSPEIRGQMDGREVQQQLADSLLFYGDAGLVLTNRPEREVQFIEGSRIGNPHGYTTSNEQSVYQNGVKVNAEGRPVAYVIGTRVNGVLRNQREVPARNFLHFFRRIRPTQYRGVPELAPAINTLQDCDEYDGLEMLAAKVAASFSAVVKRENAYEYETATRLLAEDQPSGGDEQRNLEYINPGRVDYLEPGEDISVVSSNNRPNVDGAEWVRYLLRKVGSSVGIPLEFMLMEIGGSSFSASQGVVLQYQQTVESYQTDLIKVMDRWYRWWVGRLIADGEIQPEDPQAAMRARWQRPAFRWINKAAQVKADMEYYRLGAMALDDIVAPFGYTSDEVLERKAQNIARAKEIAASIGLEDWHELINPYTTSVSGAYPEVFDQPAPAEE